VGEGMPTTKKQASAVRVQLLNQIKQLAQAAIYGSLSETYRRCGNPACDATMVVPSTVHTYTSVTAEKPERPPATMFPTM